MTVAARVLDALSSRGLALAIACALLSGCGDDPAAAKAAAAAQAAATEAEAQQAETGFNAAVHAHKWSDAVAQGDSLTRQYPGTAAAGRVAPQMEELRRKATEASERDRLNALWSYDDIAVKGGHQLSAAIFAKDAVDVDGSGPTQVRLIFRDHPEWKRSSYMVLERGDFDCYGGCKVMVKVDDKPAKPMAASRPKTDEAIAMFIEDERALWKLANTAKTIEIEFPVKHLGKRTAVFEVGGVQKGRLPGW